MSEKRFIHNSVSGKEDIFIRDRETKETIVVDLKKGDILYFVNVANELADENEQLRQSIEDYGELEYELKKCREKNKELQLKLDKAMEELDQYKYDETLYAKEIVKLNEMLKFKTLGGDY